MGNLLRDYHSPCAGRNLLHRTRQNHEQDNPSSLPNIACKSPDYTLPHHHHHLASLRSCPSPRGKVLHRHLLRHNSTPKNRHWRGVGIAVHASRRNGGGTQAGRRRGSRRSGSRQSRPLRHPSHERVVAGTTVCIDGHLPGVYDGGLVGVLQQ